MKKSLIIFIVSLLIGSASFSQVSFGLDFGSGMNKEIVYSGKYIVNNISVYQFSYHIGVYSSYSFLSRFAITTELNFFVKKSKINNIELTKNYIAIPIYFAFKMNKFRIYAGMTNNISVFNNNTLLREYTPSFKVGFGYCLSQRIDLKLFYNREINQHNKLLFENDIQKNYFNSFMLGVYIRIL